MVSPKSALMKTFLARDGRRLAFEDSEGAGPVVLCLGGLTRNSRDFDDLAAHLAPRYRVVRLDSRGRGRSEHAVDFLSEYSIPTEAGDVLALLDHLELPQVAMVGTSRGGILSMAIAGGQPERVSAVVLNDVGAHLEGRGLLRILATLGVAPTAATFEEAAVDLQHRHAHDFPGVPLEQWLQHARQIYNDDGGRPVLSYDPKLRLAVSTAIDTGEPSVTLWPLFNALLEKPVLVIRGDHSDILTGETLREMEAVHPGLASLTLADRGHAPFLNEPEALTAIDAFLAAHAR